MPTNRDRTVETILNQLELMTEMANAVGEDELARGLQSLFDTTLSTYCDRKREGLAEEMAAAAPDGRSIFEQPVSRAA